jgi:hypothetical protein
VSVFDSSEEHPPAKIRRYIITGVTFVILVVLGIQYLMRYRTEKITVRTFLTTVEAGNLEEAYKLWKPAETYSYKDFLEDWGPSGYYGPVKSFRIEDASVMKRGSESASGVIVTVAVSPFAPFPANNDEAKQNKTKEARLWVQFKDQSLGFAP